MQRTPTVTLITGYKVTENNGQFEVTKFFDIFPSTNPKAVREYIKAKYGYAQVTTREIKIRLETDDITFFKISTITHPTNGRAVNSATLCYVDTGEPVEDITVLEWVENIPNE